MRRITRQQAARFHLHQVFTCFWTDGLEIEMMVMVMVIVMVMLMVMVMVMVMVMMVVRKIIAHGDSSLSFSVPAWWVSTTQPL